MARIKIISDSTADISAELAHELDIDIVPTQIQFGDQSFRAGTELGNEQYYQLIDDGRHYYSRHDYEAVASEAAHGLYDRLEAMLPSLIGQPFAGRSISAADNFSYTDPVDQSVTKGQGLRILLDDGSRVVLRLSGTGTKGATLRVYLESYVPTTGDLAQDPQIALGEMIEAINQLAEITERTGMDRPTVIT